MVDIDSLRKMLHEQIDDVVTQWAAGAAPTDSQGEEITEVKDAGASEPVTEKAAGGDRVVRTKNSGDRVYFLDEEKKTRQWVTNPNVLDKLGFTLDDVTEVDEADLLKYAMGPALYKVDEPA